MNHHRLFPLVLLGTALLAGCSAAASGHPEAADTTAAPTTTTTNPVAQAPRVAHPLDASAFITAPCDSLSTADLTAIDQEFAGPEAVGSPGRGFAACGWASADGDKAVDIGFETDDTDGLSALYRQHQQAMMAYWQPTTVSGYPAAFGSQVDARSTGICVINVGISDHLFFFDDFQTSSPTQQPQSCSLATTLATDVLENLQAGG
jgi:hypothetical protein